MRKYSLHPTGSWCYDGKGITFPEIIPVDWNQLVGKKQYTWERRYPNLPSEVVVMATQSEAREIQERINNANLHLIVRFALY